jgi:hypothetical protein
MSAYGGIRLADAVLVRIADELRSRRVPMIMEHDIRRPLGATIRDAEVRSTPDGFKEVWIRFAVDAASWEEYQREAEEAGVAGGFSFAFSEPLATLDEHSDSGVTLELAADASHWQDEDLLSAGEALRPLGSVELARRYEFAHDPTAVVFLLIVLPIGLNLLSNALYDGLKRFVRQERPTVFHFRIQRGDEAVDARLETADADVLMRALGAFEQLAGPPPLLVWDDDQSQWVAFAGLAPVTPPSQDR